MDPSREPIDIDDPASGPQSAPATSDAEPSEGSEPAGDVEPREAGSPGAVGEHPRTEPCATPDDAEPASFDPADTLSPAVRRLVRQYDLDITGMFGTGPAGKIRVGDVIGMLGHRSDSRAQTSEETSDNPIGAPNAAAHRATRPTVEDGRDPSEQTPMQASANDSVAGAARALPATTVFECDFGRVLSHRKRKRLPDGEPLLSSYCIAACAVALRVVPEVVASRADLPQLEAREEAPRVGVLLTTTGGAVRRTLVHTDASALDEQLPLIDAQLRASADDDLHPAHILIHYYGPSGSLLATPTPFGEGHFASIGIGRVRRQVVVKAVDGQEAPRVAALCFVTLTFQPERIAFERANLFVAELVGVLEQWPLEPTTA